MNAFYFPIPAISMALAFSDTDYQQTVPVYMVSGMHPTTNKWCHKLYATDNNKLLRIVWCTDDQLHDPDYQPDYHVLRIDMPTGQSKLTMGKNDTMFFIPDENRFQINYKDGAASFEAVTTVVTDDMKDMSLVISYEDYYFGLLKEDQPDSVWLPSTVLELLTLKKYGWQKFDKDMRQSFRMSYTKKHSETFYPVRFDYLPMNGRNCSKLLISAVCCNMQISVREDAESPVSDF